MTTTPDSPFLHVLTDEDLLNELSRANVDLDKAKARKGRIEQELFSRMEQRGATGIPSDRYKCDIKVTYTYTPEVLVALKEMFYDQELATCWTPEHDEPVPEKWNITKARPIAKRHGDKALSIIEQAKVEKSRSLDFGEK